MHGAGAMMVTVVHMQHRVVAAWHQDESGGTTCARLDLKSYE